MRVAYALILTLKSPFCSPLYTYIARAYICCGGCGLIPHVLRSFYAYYLGQIETVIARLNQDLAVVLSQLQEDYKDIELVKKSEINLNVLSADVVVRNPEALGKRLFLTRDPREATLLGTSSGNSFVVLICFPPPPRLALDSRGHRKLNQQIDRKLMKN